MLSRITLDIFLMSEYFIFHNVARILVPIQLQITQILYLLRHYNLYNINAYVSMILNLQ